MTACSRAVEHSQPDRPAVEVQIGLLGPTLHAGLTALQRATEFLAVA